MPNNVFTYEERTYLISLDNNRVLRGIFWIILFMLTASIASAFLSVGSEIMMIISSITAIVMLISSAVAMFKGGRMMKKARQEILLNSRGEEKLKGGIF